MSLQASPEVNAMIFILTGEKLIDADEDLAYDSRTPYSGLGRKLDRLSSLIEKSIHDIAESMPDDLAKSYAKAMGMLIDDGGKNYLREFAEQLDKIAEGRRKTSMDIMESKWQVIAEVIRLLIEIAIYLAMSFFTGGASASQIMMAKLRSRFMILTTLSHLLQRLHLAPSLTEAFAEAFTTFAVRLAMMNFAPDGRRPDGFDWNDILKSAAFGAAAGLFTSVFDDFAKRIVKSYDHNFLKNGPDGSFKKPPNLDLKDGPGPHLDHTPKDRPGPDPSPNGPTPHRDTPTTFRDGPLSFRNNPTLWRNNQLLRHNADRPGALAGHYGLKGTADFLAAGSGEALAEILIKGAFDGDWSTSWSTFVGAGISSQVEATLTDIAINSGAELRHAIDKLRLAPPTVSGGDHGNADAARSGDGTGKGDRTGGPSQHAPGGGDSTTPADTSTTGSDTLDGTLSPSTDLTQGTPPPPYTSVDPPAYSPGPLPVTAAESALWQQVHHGTPEIRDAALRDIAALRGSQSPGSTEIGVRDALHDNLAQRPEVRVVPAGNSPAAQIDADGVRRALDSLGVTVTVDAPLPGGTTLSADTTLSTDTPVSQDQVQTPPPQAATGPAATGSTTSGSPTTGTGTGSGTGSGTKSGGVTTTGSSTSSSLSSQGAGTPDGTPASTDGEETAALPEQSQERSDGQEQEKDQDQAIPATGDDSLRPIRTDTSGGPAETSTTGSTQSSPDAAHDLTSAPPKVTTTSSADTAPSPGDVRTAPENDPSSTGSVDKEPGPVLTEPSQAPFTVVVSEQPPPVQGSPEAATLLDEAGTDRAVVLGPPTATDGAGRPVRAAVELTREGPARPVQVRPLESLPPTAGVDTGVDSNAVFPGSDVLLPLADALGTPAPTGPTSRPATESGPTLPTTTSDGADTTPSPGEKPLRTESATPSADPLSVKLPPKAEPPAHATSTAPDTAVDVPAAAKLATLSRPWFEPATDIHLESGEGTALPPSSTTPHDAPSQPHAPVTAAPVTSGPVTPGPVTPAPARIIVRPADDTHGAGSTTTRPRPQGQPVVTTLTGHTVPVTQLRRWMPGAATPPQPGRPVRTLTISQSPAEDATTHSEGRRALLGQDTFRGVRTTSAPTAPDPEATTVGPRTVFTGPPTPLPGSGTEDGADYFAGHGTSRTVTLGTDDAAHPTVKVSGVQFGEVLKSWFRDGDPKRPIVLFSCETGQQPRIAGLPVAQHVANRTGRSVYAPTTEAGTARDRDGNVRAVLTEGPDGPGRWRLFTPEPTGARLEELARAAGLHAGPEPADAFTLARTLQQIRTLRDALGPDAEQRPENRELLAGLALVDSLRWRSPDTAPRYGDGRMTPDLLRRMVTDWSGTTGVTGSDPATGPTPEQYTRFLRAAADLRSTAGSDTTLDTLLPPPPPALPPTTLVSPQDVHGLAYAPSAQVTWSLSDTPLPLSELALSPEDTAELARRRPDLAPAPSRPESLAEELTLGKTGTAPAPAVHADGQAFTRLDTPGGGNCLFRALLDSARSRPVPPAWAARNIAGLRRLLRDRIADTELGGAATLAFPDPVYSVVDDLRMRALAGVTDADERASVTAEWNDIARAVVTRGDARTWRQLLRSGDYPQLADIVPTPAEARRLGPGALVAAAAEHPGLWASPFADLLPEALAHTLDLDLRLVQPDPRTGGSTVTSLHPGGSGGTLHLAYNGTDHYDALVPAPAPAPPPPVADPVTSQDAGTQGSTAPQDMSQHVPVGADLTAQDSDGTEHAEVTTDDSSEGTETGTETGADTGAETRAETADRGDPVPLETQLDRHRPARLLTGPDAPPPAPAPRTVVFSDGSRLPEVLLHPDADPGDGTPADGTRTDGTRTDGQARTGPAGLFNGPGVTTLRSPELVARQIIGTLPKNLRTRFDETELLRLLTDQPGAFTAPRGARLVGREKSGVGLEMTVEAVPYHRWERFSDVNGGTVRVDTMRRGQAGIGGGRSVGVGRRIAGALSMGPPLNWLLKIGVSLGWTRRTDYTQGTQAYNQTEWRAHEGSHLHLDDVYYRVRVDRVTETPRSAAPSGTTGEPDPRTPQPAWRRTQVHAAGFGMRDGLSWRLPDDLTVPFKGPRRAPRTLTFPDGTEPRVTDITGLHLIDPPEDIALAVSVSRPGSSAHRTVISWVRPTRLLALFGRMTGPVTGPELTRGSGQHPLGHLIVERSVPHRATLVTESVKAELRDLTQTTYQNERGHVRDTRFGIQVTAGPNHTLVGPETDVRLQGGPLVRADLTSGRGHYLGADAARKTTGRIRNHPVALYRVERTLMVRMPGEPASAARPVRVVSLDWMATQDARRLAGWDDRTPGRTGPHPDAEPPVPWYLTRENPVHLSGQVRAEGFRPERPLTLGPGTDPPQEQGRTPQDTTRQPMPSDRAGQAVPPDTTGQPAPADTARQPAPADTARQPAPADTARQPAPPDPMRAFTDAVLDTLHRSYPSLFVPPLMLRHPRLAKFWYGDGRMRTALHNDRQIREALNRPSLAQSLDDLTTTGVPVTLTEDGKVRRGHHTLVLRARLSDRQFETTMSERSLRNAVIGTEISGQGQQASLTLSGGVELGISPRDHDKVPEAGLPRQTGNVTLGARYAKTDQKATRNTVAVAHDHLTFQNGADLYSYRVELGATFEGHRRPRGWARLATVGLLGAGVFVSKVAERPLFTQGSETVGRVELAVPAAHGSERHAPADPPPGRSAPAPTTAAPRQLSATEADQLLDGTRPLPRVDSADRRLTLKLLSAPHVVLSTEGGPQRQQLMQDTADRATGSSWHVGAPGAPARTALRRAMANLSVAGQLGQYLGPFGSRIAGLTGAGPLQTHYLKAAIRGELHNLRVKSDPKPSSLEATIGNEHRVVGSAGTVSHATVGLQGSDMPLQQAPGQQPVVGTYSTALQYAWGRGRSMAQTLTRGRNTTLTFAGRMYLVVADAAETIAVRDRWTAAMGLAGTRAGGRISSAAGRLSEHLGRRLAPRRAAAALQRVRDAVMFHLPMQDAIEAGLATDGLGTATPRNLGGGYRLPGFLRGRRFPTHPSGQLDASRAAQHLLPQLEKIGVPSHDREQVLQRLSPDFLRAHLHELTTDGMTLPVRHRTWRSPHHLPVGGSPAQLHFKLTPVTTTVERLRTGFELEDYRTIARDTATAASQDRGADVTISAAQRAAGDNANVLTASPSAQGTAAKQRSSARSETHGSTAMPNIATTQAHAEIVTSYVLTVTMADVSGTPLAPRVGASVGTLNEILPAGLLTPNGDGSDTALTEQDVPEPERAVTLLTADQARPDAIAAWRTTTGQAATGQANPGPATTGRTTTSGATAGSAITDRTTGQATTGPFTTGPATSDAHPTDSDVLPFDDAIGSGILAVDILGADNVRDGLTLATARADGFGDSDLGRRHTGDLLAARVRMARLTPLTGLGTAPAQAQQEATSQGGLTAGFREALGPDGSPLPTQSSARLLGQSHTADSRLYAKMHRTGARLLAVENKPRMEAMQRRKTSDALEAGITDNVEGAVGTSPLAGNSNAGVTNPGATVPIGGANDSTALKGSADTTLGTHVKVVTDRSMLFAVPVSWLAVSEVRHQVTDSRPLYALGKARRGPRAAEARTTALVWLREDIARDYGLLDDTTYPDEVSAAWDAQAKATADLATAEQRYYDARARARDTWLDLTPQEQTALGDPTTDQASVPASPAVTAWRAARDEARLWEQRTDAAAAEHHRLHLAATRLTAHHRGPSAAPAPERPAYTEPAWRSEAPAPYTVSAATDSTPRTLTSPDGATVREVHDVPQDGASFFHALLAVAADRGRLAHLLGTDLADRFTAAPGNPTITAEAVGAARDRLAWALGEDSNQDLLDSLALDAADTFTQDEIDAAGIHFTPAQQAEFDAFGRLPQTFWPTPGQRVALAALALSRPFASEPRQDTGAHPTDGEQTPPARRAGDHGGADLLPALAARVLGTPLTVVTGEGRSQLFLPHGADPATVRPATDPVLFAAGDFFHAALPPGTPPPVTTPLPTLVLTTPLTDNPAPRPTPHRSHATPPWMPPAQTSGPRYRLDRDGVLTAPDGATYTQGPHTGRGNGFFGALSTALRQAAEQPGLHRREAARLRTRAGATPTQLMRLNGLPGDPAERAMLFTPPPLRTRPGAPAPSPEALEGHLRRHLSEAPWSPEADRALARWAAAATGTTVTLIEENGTAHTYAGPSSDSPHLRLRRRGGDIVPLVPRTPAPVPTTQQEEEEASDLSTLSGAETATPSTATEPVLRPFKLGRFEFPNLNQTDRYLDKAVRIAELLDEHTTIRNYIGDRTVRITLHVRTTETPADVIDRGDNGVDINLASYYFEKYDTGYIMGMLAHEIGLHPLASRDANIAEQEEAYQGMPLTVPGLTDLNPPRVMNSASAGQRDHIMAAYPPTIRHRLYRNIIIEMAHVLAQRARVGVPGAKNQDVTDLFDTYLMDLASIAVTSDYRLNAVKEPNYTARVYNAYKDQLRDALGDNTTLKNLLPSNKTLFGVARNFTQLATAIATNNRGDSIQQPTPPTPATTTTDEARPRLPQTETGTGTDGTAATAVAPRMPQSSNTTPTAAEPVLAPFKSGNFEFTNLKHTNEKYRDKAIRIIELLRRHDTIRDYVGDRTVRITLHVRTTETPADVIDRGDDGVDINLASYYFEKYDTGYIMGMLAHEIGLHPLASRNTKIPEEEDLYRGMPLLVPGLDTLKEPRFMNTEGAGQEDHIMAAFPHTIRHGIYRDIVLTMAGVLAEDARNGEEGAKARDVTDLVDTYLMDLATIAVTNDRRKDAAWEPRYTARVYNAYKEQFAALLPADSPVRALLPANKSWYNVTNNFLGLGASFAFNNQGDSIQTAPPRQVGDSGETRPRLAPASDAPAPSHGSPGAPHPARARDRRPRFVVRSGFDARRFTYDGEPVTDLTVRVALRGTDDEAARVFTALQAGVQEFLNAPGHLLPGGDRLHVTVERVDPAAAGADTTSKAPHLTVDLVGRDRPMDQTTWWADADPVHLVHELTHQLGLRDEYRDGDAPHRPHVLGSLLGDLNETPEDSSLAPAGLRGRHLHLLQALIGEVEPRPGHGEQGAERMWAEARGGTAPVPRSAVWVDPVSLPTADNATENATNGTPGTEVPARMPQSAGPAPAASQPAFTPFRSGNYEFTNLKHTEERYRDKAVRVIELLQEHPTIRAYVGSRPVRITLHVRTTETPADVRDLGDQGVQINLASYYFEKYDTGYLMGMLAHEIGLHPLASRNGNIPDEESMFQDIPLPVPGLADLATPRTMSTRGAGQADHIMAAFPSSTRHGIYRNIVVEMAETLARQAQAGEEGAKASDVTDLFDCYLMDLASIAITNDYRMNAAKEPNYTARVYNAYKEMLEARLVDKPALKALLPTDKSLFGVINDFRRIGTYIALNNRGDSIQRTDPN
ncbi:WXG100-like domain-containing protein [Streptomyces dubilierae]|uniref:Outer membrane channel protein CpnT-like N-terminal domain-containing protein n=1 Tax=Streptomyces dubilierae TaxID=3075533 RepID=A0ABU2P258_9ACTN|nr:hypothetical protein [Streptomyces sp. DSM 41921]MDT0386231.1 hypothetical protein [Streptomyces sp. DSM 41921]